MSKVEAEGKFSEEAKFDQTTNSFELTVEDEGESSVVDSSDNEDDIDETTGTEAEDDVITTRALGTQIAFSEISSISQSLQELLSPVNSIQTLGNVSISNSTNVHIGNVTNINGNITIINDGTGSIERQKKRRSKDQSKSNITNNVSTSQQNGSRIHSHTPERRERVKDDSFLIRPKFKIPKSICPIIERSFWLAQTPLEEYIYMQEPVEYVVISHTATESSEQQRINVRTIRYVQCFHIESQGWNDIAYNFLIGLDGNIYEGRGWGVVGAHTRGYNTRALGITFIGCFMRELPTVAALNACKNLLKKGVKEGHLIANYKLICHCQCRPTESPGRKLFEELQTWEQFYSIENADDLDDSESDDCATKNSQVAE